MQTPLDLTALCGNFPSLPDPQVSRDNILELIQRKFSDNNRILVLNGPAGAGKTTIIAQFASLLSDRCLSFFIGTTITNSDPRYIMLDLCGQMAPLLNKSSDAFDKLSTDELRNMYFDWYRRIAMNAKKLRTPIHFAIDGLERLQEGVLKTSVLSLLPTEPGANIYMLMSTEAGCPISFQHETIDLPMFSLRDTQQYLQDLVLDAADVERLHKTCGGIPGSLAAIRRLVKNGVDPRELPSQLPNELRGTFDLEWSRAALSDEVLRLVGIMAYSKTHLDLTELGHLTGLEEPEIESAINALSFVFTDKKTNTARFVSDAYQNFIAEKLSSRREQAEETLIEHYSNNPHEDTALVLLPSYLAKPKEFQRLKALITPDYLTRALTTKRDVGVLQRTLKLVTEQALVAEDWYNVPKYVLVSAMLRSAVDRPVAHAEIEALLELKDFSSALETAYQALLAEDRLQLIAMIGSRMRQKGLSLPENIIGELEQMADSIDVAHLRERAVEIAAVLYDLLPQSAVQLLERSAGASRQFHSLDAARALLTLRIEAAAAENDFAEPVKSQISDEAIKDFTRSVSPRIARLSAESLVAEMQSIKNTSGKMFGFIAWCNANRTSPDAAKVVATALNAIDADPSYPTSMRLLRQLVEPLINDASNDLDELIARFDLLRSTAINKPEDERVRLELLLAQLEARVSVEKALQRVLDVYLSLEDVAELDVRCHCFAHLLVALPAIDQTDKLKFQQEVEPRFIIEYQQLLSRSAEHLAISRRLLRVLVSYKPDLAVRCVELINTVERRDIAYLEILIAYSKRPAANIDVTFFEKVLSLLSEQHRREYAQVRLVQSLASQNILSIRPDLKSILRYVSAMKPASYRCYGAAYALKAVSAINDAQLIEGFQEILQSALLELDAEWERTETAFTLATVVAQCTPELARDLLKAARASSLASPLANTSFAEMYLKSLRLAIRAFSGFLKSGSNADARRHKLIELIRLVPSQHDQCDLLSDLALHHKLHGDADGFTEIVEGEVIPFLQSCSEPQAHMDALVAAAPVFFEYDNISALDQVASLPSSLRHQALQRIFDYLLSGTSPDDPVNMDALRVGLNGPVARRVCQVIGVMEDDSRVFFCMDQLINALILPDVQNSSRERCQLIERDALDVARRLEDIAKKKFPQKTNIRHNGYLVASQAAITRLRAASLKRAHSDINWPQIAQDARNIPNDADKALVLAMLGERIYKHDAVQGSQLLRSAEKVIKDIPNLLDRASRFYGIADAWKKVNKKEEARLLLQEAMKIVQVASDDQNRDRLTGQILQLAHSLDPDFASTLTPLLENPLQEHLHKMDLSAANLKSNPQQVKLEKYRSQEELQYVLGQAAWRLYEELNTGKGHIRSPKEIATWLGEMGNGDIDSVLPVVAWAIRNTQSATTRPDVLADTFDGIMEALQVCYSVGSAVLGIREHNIPIMHEALPKNLLLFRAGRRSDALVTVEEWLQINTSDYLIIYDPYFTPGDLSLLRDVPLEVEVTILTSWSSQKGISPGDRKIRTVFAEGWCAVSDQPPPQTQVVVVGIKSGDSPLHSRYILTSNQGLCLGTSVSGLGLKDTDIRILDAQEASSIESEFVDWLLKPSLRLFKGEKMIKAMFMLDAKDPSS